MGHAFTANSSRAGPAQRRRSHGPLSRIRGRLPDARRGLRPADPRTLRGHKPYAASQQSLSPVEDGGVQPVPQDHQRRPLHGLHDANRQVPLHRMARPKGLIPRRRPRTLRPPPNPRRKRKRNKQRRLRRNRQRNVYENEIRLESRTTVMTQKAMGERLTRRLQIMSDIGGEGLTKACSFNRRRNWKVRQYVRSSLSCTTSSSKDRPFIWNRFSIERPQFTKTSFSKRPSLIGKSHLSFPERFEPSILSAT